MLWLKNAIVNIVYAIGNTILFTLESILSLGGFNRKPKTVLVFRTGSLGDMLCAVPAFKALRRAYPGSKLILFTKDEPLFNQSQPLESIIGSGIFDSIIRYEYGKSRSFIHALRLIGKIRKLNVDLLVYFGQYDIGLTRMLKDMFFFYISSCRRLFGFRLHKILLFRGAQQKIRKFDHEVDRLLKKIIPLGIKAASVDFNLSIAAEDKLFIDQLLSASGRKEGTRMVAINPGAKWPVNYWDPNNFIDLANKLIDSYGFFIVLVGGSEIEGICALIKKGIKKPNMCLNLCGKSSLLQTMQLLSECELLVSLDSGPVHMAAAIQTPVVGIYTARDFANCWYPYGSNNLVIRHDTSCQVCLKTTCNNMSCIKGITVDEVFAACAKLINNKDCLNR